MIATNDHRSTESIPWRRLVNALVRDQRVVRESADSLRFVVVTRERPVRVGIRVRATTIYGEEVIVVAADLGYAHRLDASVALQLNAALVHGTLVVDAGVLYLRSRVALASDTAMMQHSIRLLAAEAAELKRRLSNISPEPSSTAAFGHFGD